MTMSEVKMTAEQFELLGEDPPGIRLELAHGEIVMSPSASYRHLYVDNYLRFLITQHILEHDLGELVGDIDAFLDQHNVRRPDIVFTAKSRLHLLDDSMHGVRYAPDLCVEIISPGSAVMDQTDKFDLYAQSGIAHYWLVDPIKKTFTAFKLIRKRYVQEAFGTKSDVVSAPPFPKLQISLARIWPPKRK